MTVALSEISDRSAGALSDRSERNFRPSPTRRLCLTTLIRQPRRAAQNNRVGGRRRTVDDLDDPNKVWPTGLTIKESEALHRHVIDGSRVFFVIALFAHMLAYIYSPWLK
jgi:light-harvesting protein B-800-850 beta chain